jgi:type IV pilus assembly protein PilM
MDPQLVAEVIRSLIKNAGIKTKSIVASVGGRDVIIKKIQMDRMKPAEAREIIRWEAEQYVPFDMQNVQLDFQILDPMGEGLQMDVLLVAAKRELVDQKVALLRDAGIAPTLMDVDAFALHNAFEYNYPGAMDGTVALVNVGNELSSVNLLLDGNPVITPDVAFGARRVRENLARQQGLSAQEAESMISGSSSGHGELESVIADGADELAMSIERAVAFVATSEYGGLSLGKVFLCGGGSQLPGLPELLADRTRARTEVATPLQLLRVRPGATQLPTHELAPMFMLPVGLALRATA